MPVSITHEDLKSLPNLPGFSITDYKERYPKQQTWSYVNGQRIEQKEGLSHDRPKFVRTMKAQEQWRKGSLPDSTTRAVFKNAGGNTDFSELPAWDALDRHVLRFHGYFKEAVVETNLENYRVRRVIVFYYLEDDTAHITEPRQDNSGIPQGTLIRRHRFPAPGGGYITPQDLQVGGDLKVYGRTIRLTDCDAFTREYYAQLGQEQMAPVDVEMDPFSRTQEAIKMKEAAAPRTYEKIYREVMLGGGHINADMQQFLEMDRKVLRFFAVLDDLSTPQFERRPFTIMFFMADDNVEIREQYPLNCGRDNFPIFFRKAKMAKGPVSVDGPQSQPRKKSEFVHGHDFFVGQHVTLMGTNFFIYDADDFTRQYFRDVLDVDLEPKQDVQLPERAVPRAVTPPYNGYGTWDDSMGSVTHLIPKPPQKNFQKLFHNDGKILRFTARFADPKPEDVDRLFVVNFYLFDETLSIHEPPQRNLGIVTGKFLDKAVHVNQVTGKLFEVGDLLPGRTIKVYNHEFELLDCDEYTRKLLSDPNARHRKFDLTAVIEKIRESMRQQFPLVRDIFRRFDTDHDGVLTLAEFKKGLEKFGFMLSDEEVVTIMKHFDTREDGQISYNEFCDALLDEDYTTSMLKTKPHLQHDRFDQQYAERTMLKHHERFETDAVRKAVREVGDVLYKHVGFQKRLFREFAHMTHLPIVTSEQIQYAFQQLGHSFDIADIQRTVAFIMPDAELNAINYVEFFKALQAAYHDLSAVR
eukprot:CAMPEP_0117501572 /NCGR_PEP_ID=MMETSP0784-20121206/23369_1 /TAXON_ID=39447 /ORGANISM="" /LENGTH=749 /DNA_ID=CAMNT_0005296833 /DNA_START=115 /DNA_END=2364 /DNA_ORIENTATION=+